MPSPPKKMEYNIYYTDTTYLTYSLTAKELDELLGKLELGKKLMRTSFGMLVLDGIRSIVKREEPKPEKLQKVKDADPPLDADAAVWLEEQRKIAEQWLREHDEEDELDGGRFS